MLELLIIGSLGAISMALLVWHLHTLRRQPASDLIERVQFLSEGLLNLQHTLDARLDHSTQALNTSLLTGLTQLTTQLVSRVDGAHLDSQMAMEERLRAVQHELQRQLDTLRTTMQDSLSDSRRELFGMITALQQGVEQRLSDVRRHVADIAHKYIQPPVTLDFALMFIPAENVYYEVLLSDETLEFARSKRVVPVSPNTLYAYLQAISIGFRGLKIAQETRRIEQLLLGLKKNFDEFKEHFRLIGRHLDRARGQFIQTESDVTRFDHTIGSIQFGTLHEQLPSPGHAKLSAGDVSAEP